MYANITVTFEHKLTIISQHKLYRLFLFHISKKPPKLKVQKFLHQMIHPVHIFKKCCQIHVYSFYLLLFKCRINLILMSDFGARSFWFITNIIILYTTLATEQVNVLIVYFDYIFVVPTYLLQVQFIDRATITMFRLLLSRDMYSMV